MANILKRYRNEATGKTEENFRQLCVVTEKDEMWVGHRLKCGCPDSCGQKQPAFLETSQPPISGAGFQI